MKIEPGEVVSRVALRLDEAVGRQPGGTTRQSQSCFLPLFFFTDNS